MGIGVCWCWHRKCCLVFLLLTLAMTCINNPTFSSRCPPGRSSHWDNVSSWYLLEIQLIHKHASLSQDSETLLSLSRSEGGAISLSLGLKTKRLPSSSCLLIHFHGGGFVAQTSKSHEVRLYSLYSLHKCIVNVFDLCNIWKGMIGHDSTTVHIPTLTLNILHISIIYCTRVALLPH